MRKSFGAWCTIIAVGTLLSACATFMSPKGYIPDDKAVFLREKLEFGPVRYDPIRVDPYSFAPYAGAVHVQSPDFLRIADFDSLLKADFVSDSKLYREVEGHLAYIEGLPDLAKMRARLDAEAIVAPPPLPAERGNKTKDYSNGAQYAYPDAPGALITVLNDGEYFIDFPDKSAFKYFGDGSYSRLDADGKELFSYNKTNASVVLKDGDATFTADGNFRRMDSPLGRLEYATDPVPQYQYSPPGAQSWTTYTIFVTPEKATMECSITNAAGLRFDYLTENKNVLVTTGSRAVVLDSTFRKQQAFFDTKLNKPTSVLSVFLPEGLRLANLPGPGPSYVEMNPVWPENYKSATLGPFKILYTAKDEALLARLSAARLTEIEAGDRSMTGFGVTQNRTIIIPPDLTSYCRLHASKPGSVLSWYPTGFETRDYIVMWPISVPRYDSPAGQDYFFQHEFYEIVAHEYVHLMVGENTGLMSPVPTWLNEGLAVYVESQVSPDCKAYWDLTFAVSRDRHLLLDWDDATIHGTEDFPMAQARVHYAQSYAFVSALMAKYGAAKVAEYVRSFRVKPEDADKVVLKADYRTKFRSVFGIDFDEALKLLQPTQK